MHKTKYCDFKESYSKSSNKSLLSLDIKEFYESSNTPISDDGEYKGYFLEDFTFNWREIEKHINLPPNYSAIPLTYTDSKKYVLALRPIWQTSSFNQCYVEDQYGEMLQWIDNNGKLLQHLNEFNVLRAYSNTNVLEGVLLMTSLLENSFGNIYYTITNKIPPHLLRDLLSEPTLINFFGQFPMFFLRLIMGHPNAVNLRNIAWHGFPTATEIPKYYHSLLVICIASLSKIVVAQSILIKERKHIFIDNLNNIGLCANNVLSNLDFGSVLSRSKSVPNSHKEIWLQILTYFETGFYWKCLILILPQIELMLRVIYGFVNNVDITAKLEEYYITMDTIFEDALPNKKTPNKIFNSLSNGTLKLIYDLFICSTGPRIRDKVSHGEIDYNCIGKRECMMLLHLSLNLMLEDESQTFSLKSYESYFHINVIILRSIESARKNFERLAQIDVPPQFLNTLPNPNLIVIHNISKVGRIKIFHRHKKEPEIVHMLLKITRFIQISCENLCISIKERSESLQNKQLRSKRRNTLHKMLSALSTIIEILAKMINTVIALFWRLQNFDNTFLDEHFVNAQKFVKSFLKAVENLAKYTHKSCNEWIRSLDICSNFNNSHDKYKKQLFD